MERTKVGVIQKVARSAECLIPEIKISKLLGLRKYMQERQKIYFVETITHFMLMIKVKFLLGA